MKYPTTNPSLLERVRNGDEISWNEFYHRYSPVIRCVGACRHLDEAACDDLVQMVMLKFFGAAKHYTYREGEAKFRTYFAAVIRSQAAELIRGEAHQKNLRPDTAPETTEPFDEVFMNEWRKAVLADAKSELRQRVNERTYQAFELYALQGRPVEQVAPALGMSANRIYVAKKRCTDILRGIVARHNRNDGELELEI